MWVDDWHDIIRVISLGMAIVCLTLLGKRFAKSRDQYNTKTRDYWYATVLWCVASVALALEGMYEDRPMEPRLIFYTLATAVTLKGLLSKSDWGHHE